ncbi:MAG: ribose-5-phosphate isomerase RpiA [Treponema sp.]|jgi:ribose 5-phosphate isomerase A|nr:ribose-5-phosphate isomerase RpiA [Treponema sp.]
MDPAKLKEKAAIAAVDSLVKSGMKLGLGTGSTAVYAVRYIGSLLAEGKLRNIMAVSTSFQTTIECEKNGIPLFTMNSREIGGKLDLDIDGADEVDSQNRCIKGGGGALLLEKLIAYASDVFAIVIDESKITKTLGAKFPVPVEVIPEAWFTVRRKLEKFGAEVNLREAVRKAGPVVTDHGNFILDVRFSGTSDLRKPEFPALMEAELNRIPGVVENGFFYWRPEAGSMDRPVIFIGLENGEVERRD